MKNVKILTGFITSRKYLNLLQTMYENKNFNVQIIRPNKYKILIPYFYNDFNKLYNQEIKEYDLIHALSGSNLSMIPYLNKYKKTNNLLICDSTAYIFPPTESILNTMFPKFYKSYDDIATNHSNDLSFKILNTILKYTYTLKYQQEYFDSIDSLIDKNQLIMIHSKKDDITPCGKYENLIVKNGKLFENGVHSKMFELDENKYYLDEISEKYNKFK